MKNINQAVSADQMMGSLMFFWNRKQTDHPSDLYHHGLILETFCASHFLFEYRNMKSRTERALFLD